MKAPQASIEAPAATCEQACTDLPARDARYKAADMRCLRLRARAVDYETRNGILVRLGRPAAVEAEIEALEVWLTGAFEWLSCRRAPAEASCLVMEVEHVELAFLLGDALEDMDELLSLAEELEQSRPRMAMAIRRTLVRAGLAPSEDEAPASGVVPTEGLVAHG